ncbi:30S ribosomal protein S12 methylthiotransferase accessory factor YcaO [Rhodoferax antarcticus]|uniref:30S ribosomal protein S12 methylthiotransferase accessory factor YcaO n=1 Tax=Rhodoferax antarcticus TaxID=81479 RepID=UPI00222474E4|nr:30S ribosomal protein S12 methylthiotransferase accessory factor YcaO [Rhodoferax antarcticus]MCW2310297.1 ribosomal protein S12 methylthiotransferase accessory factor [Rhodoferax antarcticus]
MHNTTFIPGKDAALESTITALQGKLQHLGFHVEERSWLNPVEGIWSVHIRDRDCPLLFTNGKGASRLACLASALGEFLERLSTNYFWTHFYLGPDVANRDFVFYPQERWFALPEDGNWPATLLTPELQALYNPQAAVEAESLVDFNSGNDERGICAIPYVRERDGAIVYFPVNIIGNLYVSNGMSAGNTQAEARAQALSEIFERAIKARIISEGICLPDVPEEVIARYPRVAKGIAALREAGFGILVKDASLGGQYPVMNVTLLNPQDQGCFASFGAHPRFEVALERALTELLQGRALEALSGFPAPGFDLEETASSTNIEIHFVDSSGVIHWKFLGNEPDFEFVDWNFSSTTAEDVAWCVQRLHTDGQDIYIADFTHLGVYACRILVPGLSEIYPIDDLEFENNSVVNTIREAILNLRDLDDQECTDLLETLNDSSLADHRPVPALIGLAADAGSFWADLRLGELKTLLALAVGDEAATLEGCEWILNFDQLNPQRKPVYACIQNLIQLADMGDSGPYLDALSLLYGAGPLAQAHALIMQEDRFMGLSAPGMALAGCEMHQKLLQAYDKVYPAHAAR